MAGRAISIQLYGIVGWGSQMGRLGLVFQHLFKLLPLSYSKDLRSKAFSVLRSALLSALTFALFAVPIFRR